MDPQPASATPAAAPDAARQRVLTRQRQRVWLPFAAGLLVFITLMVALVVAAGPQIGVVANLIAITFCLIPLLVMSFLFMIGTAAAIWGVGRLDATAVRQTTRAESAAADLAGRTRDTARSAGSRVIGIAAAVERMAPLWDIFDSDATKGDGDGTQHAADDPSARS